MVWIKRIQYRMMLAVLALSLGSVVLCGCGSQKADGKVSAQQQTGTEQAQLEQAQAEEAQTEQTQTEEAQAVKLQEENSMAEWEASLEQGEVAELSAESVRGVSVVRNGVPCYTVSYEPRTYKNTFDCWAISVPYQSMTVVDTEAMYEYFRILTDMELQPVKDIARSQAGLEDVTNSIYVAYYREQTAEGGQAAPDRGITYRFGTKDEAGDYYVEAGGEIWTADADAVDSLFAVNPYEHILKVVSVVSVESVSAVEITFGDSRYEMKIGEETFRFGEKAVNSAAFYELYTELMSVFIEDELAHENASDDDRELLMTITYHRNTKEAPQIIQRYYVYDDTYASVQVNGTEFFLVSREGLEQLQDKIRAAFADSMD